MSKPPDSWNAIAKNARQEAKRREEAKQFGGLIATPMSEVERTEIRWLWQSRIPLGKLCLLSGDPGLGKSFITMDIAARVSAALDWPDGGTAERGRVLLLNAEDDASDTLGPRLDAIGADCSRILTVGREKALVRLDQDVDHLERLVQRHKASLVVIDPVMSYMGDVQTNSDPAVRAVLQPLHDMAERCRCAVLLVMHLNKKQGVSAAYRTGGSIAFTGIVRAGFMVARSKNDPALRVLHSLKNNNAKEPPALGYKLDDAGSGVARVIWTGVVDEDLNEALAPTRAGPSVSDTVKDWLQRYLAAGPVSAAEVLRAAKAAGISKSTLNRVKPGLAASYKDGQVNMWHLVVPSQGGEDENVENVGKDEG